MPSSFPATPSFLGEKYDNTAGDYYMDLLEGAGNDIAQVAEQSRHGNPNINAATGVAVPAWRQLSSFADGSARYIRCPKRLSTRSTSGASAMPTGIARITSTRFERPSVVKTFFAFVSLPDLPDVFSRQCSETNPSQLGHNVALLHVD